MPLQAPRVAHDPADRHAAGHLHDHRHDHRHADLPGRPADDYQAALPSPLWWSASLRLACAAVLSLGLWLVIAWATA